MTDLFTDRPFFSNLQDRRELVGIEIGVDRGDTSIKILKELDVSILYLIDPYENYGGFSGSGVLESKEVAMRSRRIAEEKLKDYSNKIIWMISFAERCFMNIPDNLDFVYVDGNHRYEYVLLNILLYYPKVKKCGLLGGHDFKDTEPDVFAAVKNGLTHFGIKEIRLDNWDWWIEK